MKKFFALLALLCIITGLAIANGNQETKTVTIGSKDFTEQYVSSNLIALLLEENGFKIEENFGIGSANVRELLNSGEIDLYPEYTGTAWQVYLNQEESVSNPVDLYNKVKSQDAQNGIIWLDRWALNNTYALGIKQEDIQKFGTSISSLGEYISKNPTDVIIGSNSEFYVRKDGLFQMASIYGFQVNRNHVKTMETGLGYEALSKGTVDVAMVFATDGRLKKYNLKVLEDDKHFFPPYNMAVTVREEIFNQYPEIEAILKQLSVIDDKTMQDLNYQVDVEEISAKLVARNYLEEKGLIK